MLKAEFLWREFQQYYKSPDLEKLSSRETNFMHNARKHLNNIIPGREKQQYIKLVFKMHAKYMKKQRSNSFSLVSL